MKSNDFTNRSTKVFISSLFSKKKYYLTKTFTYYIPAPPTRKNGYRENEFDNIIAKLVSTGYEIISLNSQSHSSEEKSGMWIICHIGAANKEIANREIELDNLQLEQTDSKIKLDPSIIHEF